MDNGPESTRRGFFKGIGYFLYGACSNAKDSVLYGFGERNELKERVLAQSGKIEGLKTELYNQEINYLANIKQLTKRLIEVETQYQKNARINQEQISQLERRLELTFGLVKWKEQKISDLKQGFNELRKKWFVSLGHLLNYVFREEPYVIVDSQGVISEVSERAKILFRYGGEAIGKHYSSFVDEGTKNKSGIIGRQFLRGEANDIFVEDILLDFYKGKKIKVNATVFPCVGPRDTKGRETNAGYFCLFDRPSQLRSFNKNKIAKSYAKQMFKKINAFLKEASLKEIGEKIRKKKEELKGDAGLAGQPA